MTTSIALLAPWATRSAITIGLAFAAALQWLNPAVWLMLESVRITAEESADDEVLARSANAIAAKGWKTFDEVKFRFGGLDRHAGSGGGSLGLFMGQAGFGVPESLQTADFESGRGFDDINEVAENRNGNGDLNLEITPGVGGCPSEMRGGKLVESTNASTEIWFKVPREFAEKDWRLVADAKGYSPSLTVVNRNLPMMHNGQLQIEARCVESMDRIDRIVLEGRDYSWAEVANVHLYPGSAEVHP